MRDARAIAEAAARDSYGRLVAFLAAQTRNVALAEDALADAFAAALEHWPATGAPDNPEAWLLTAARRKLIDGARRATTHERSEPRLALAIEEAQALAAEGRFVDERLKLLFICAHPAIDAGIRTPLMLQAVLGLDAARIASAFLVSPATMGQRLVRAKKKIADAAIPFEFPDEALDARAGAVLDAIYAAFNAGSDLSADEEQDQKGLASEAIYLADLVARLLGDSPEAFGLLALCLYIESRRPARRRDGAFVSLDDQDTAQWDRDMIARADACLERAAGFARAGRFQLEAAIQSAHVARRLTGADTRAAVVVLYDRLIAEAPSTGAAIARAAALARLGRLDDALAGISALPDAAIAAHQPYWATLAHILELRGERERASAAYERAIGLCRDDAARRFLRTRQASLELRAALDNSSRVS